MACLFLLGPCPEMTDWQLCKAVAAEARATGKSVKSLYPIYKKLKQVKDSILKMSQEIEKMAGGALGGFSKATAKEVNNLIMNSKNLAYGFEKTEQYAKDALNALKALERSDDSFVTAAGKMLQMINDEKCGMSVFAKVLVTDSQGKITQAGEEVLNSAFKDISLVLAEAERAPEYAGDLYDCVFTLHNFIHQGLKPEVLNQLKTLTTRGLLALRGGAPKAAIEALTEFEKTLMDSKNFVSGIEDIMDTGSYDVSYIMNALRKFLERGYNEVVNTYKGTIGFLLT